MPQSRKAVSIERTNFFYVLDSGDIIADQKEHNMSIQPLARRLTLLAIVAFSSAPAATAAPWFAPKHTKQRIVHLRIRNDSDQVIAIHAGAQHYSIGSHVTVKADIVEGDAIILDTGTQTVPAGTRVVTVVADMNDATIALK